MKNRQKILGFSILLSSILLFLTQPQFEVFAQEADSAGAAGELGWFTLIPPAIAIILAFISKDVILSLFLGVFSGSVILQLYSGTNIFMSLIDGFIGVVEYALNSLADPWNAGIILQVMAIGGLIAVITKTGGARAVAEGLSKYAKGPISTQLITWVLGLLVFFDDYANALMVGPIMRPVSDKMNNSRERLSFVIDATAAPVAGIALISTWIGYELSLINETFSAMGETVNAYGFFLESIPYRFYNLFMLAFVVITSITLKEYGPMKKAQMRSRDTGQLIDESSKGFQQEEEEEEVGKGSIWNAIVPIGLLILLSFVGFYTNGRSALLAEGNQEIVQLFQNSPFSFAAIREAFGASDASIVIFQAALASSIVAILMGIFQKRFNISDGIETWVNGMKSLIMTAIVLLLAWSLSTNMADIGTAQFLVSLLDGVINPIFLPSIIFIFAAITSFATGTAYGTMGILIPLALPLAASLAPDGNLATVALGSVLAGAILGDHASPISDTTILSSTGAGSDLMDHVKTQLPYVLTVGAFAIIFGYIPAAAGLSVWIILPVGIILLALFVYFVGTKVDTSKPNTED